MKLTVHPGLLLNNGLHLSALPVQCFYLYSHFRDYVLKFTHLSLLFDHYLLVAIHSLPPSLFVFPELPLKLSLQKLQPLLILCFEILFNQVFGLCKLGSAIA